MACRGRHDLPAPTAAPTPSTSAAARPTYTLDPAADFMRGELCTISVQRSTSSTRTPTTRQTTCGRLHSFVHARSAWRPADPRHPGRAPPLAATTTTRRRRRPRRRHRGEHQRLLVQDPQADRDEQHLRGHLRLPAAATRPPVGTPRSVSGRVQEFQAAGWGPGTTSRSPRSASATVDARRERAPIAPTVIGLGGRFRAEPHDRRRLDRRRRRRTRGSTRRRTASTSTRASRACSCSSTTRRDRADEQLRRALDRRRQRP